MFRGCTVPKPCKAIYRALHSTRLVVGITISFAICFVYALAGSATAIGLVNRKIVGLCSIYVSQLNLKL